METIAFKHAGVDYEIRIVSDGETVYIKAFKSDGRPANGFRYEVKIETAVQLRELLGDNAVVRLVDEAKKAIQEGFC